MSNNINNDEGVSKCCGVNILNGRCMECKDNCDVVYICGNCGEVFDKVNDEGWCKDCSDITSFAERYG
jgi:hypothetical protein